MFKYFSTTLFSCIIITLLVACTANKQESINIGNDMPTSSLDSLAEAYVKLVLQVGRYNPDYVDAYYGPEEWKPAQIPPDSAKNFPYEKLSGQVNGLIKKLEEVDRKGVGEMENMRHTFLQKQLTAVKTEIELLSGKQLTFDEESGLLYDAVAPTYTETHFRNLLQQLEKALPGKGIVSQRLNAFKEGFIIPKEKLDTVFDAAIRECRNRTIKHIDLPENENFTVEYVTNKPWSAYNWYKGNAYSLIQVNTDLPIFIDRAIDLACHEGYPGHHVFNALLEKNLVRGRNWVEFSVYPLFSPQSLIAEGSANYGIDVAFPGQERVDFEREVLFPLAGLDPAKAATYYQIQDLTEGLSYAGNEAARQYLNGKISKEKAIDWLVKYALMSPERATQRIDFIEKYRSYVINYNLGQDMVGQYIERNGGSAANPQKRWELFEELLSKPYVPSMLKPE